MKGVQNLNRKLLERSGKGYPGREDVEECFRLLRTEKSISEELEKFYREKLKLLVLVLLGGMFLTVAVAVSESSSLIEDRYFLPRRQQAYTREFTVVPDKESGKEKEEVTVEIEPQGLTAEQIKELLAEESGRMESYILGKNHSLEEVRTDLNLLREIEGTPITVEWDLDSYEVLNVDGSIRKEKVTEEGTIVGLRGRLRCEGQESVYEAYARILPEILSPAEQWRKALLEAVERLQKKTSLQTRKELPEEVDGVVISWKEKKSSTAAVIPVLTLLCLILVYVARDQELKKQVKEREGELRRDYAQVVSKLVLLMGAGSAVRTAWERMVRDYERKREAGGVPRYVYEEMALACREMQNGISEGRAYENFGIRCRQPCYLKLSALLEQNLEKGNKGLSELLKAGVTEAFEQRKELAREQGEKASTRLLLPMVLMLAVVMLLVLVPAGMSMQV